MPWHKTVTVEDDDPSLKKTLSHMKMDGWKISFLVVWPIFRGENVRFRECKAYSNHSAPYRNPSIDASGEDRVR